MTVTIEGNMSAAGHKIGIVVSRWNGFITERLLEGAVDAFTRHGGSEDDLVVVRVPGAFELGGAAEKLAEHAGLDAIVCIGALIRGATPHFDYISAEATKAIGGVGRDYGLPVSYGLLTCDTIEQAIERAGTKAGNKGVEAVTAAIEMVNLYRSIGAQYGGE